MNPNCIERRDSTVAPQALHLMNNGMVAATGRAVRRARVRREAGTDRQRQIERVYLIALGRPPSDEEKQLGLEALERLAAEWRQAPGSRRHAGRARRPASAGDVIAMRS